MTFAQIGGLATHLKRRRPIADWLEGNPDVDPREARALAIIYGKQPFPSIQGNPPVYRNRPYYDARLLENA